MRRECRRGIFLALILILVARPGRSWSESTNFNYFEITDMAKLQNEYGAIGTLGSVLSSSGSADENVLYSRIFEAIGKEYEVIGQRQAALALGGRGGFTIDGINNIGYSYHQDFVDFKISLTRSLAPDLFSDTQWIVSDRFEVLIDASTVLSNLRDKEIIDISDQNLALFGGVQFKRVYTYMHFAESYEDGLVLDLEKLFFAFRPFRSQSFLEMKGHEYISKEDSLSFRAGAFVSAPLYQGVSVSAGFLGRYDLLAKSEIQVVGEDDHPAPGEKFRLSYEKSSSTELGASARINADFLGLLQISLLSFDFSYTAGSSHKVNLSLYESDLARLKTDTRFSAEIDKVLKHRKADIDILAPNIVSQELRRQEKISSKYSILIAGGMREQETEQVQVYKDGLEKQFFRHNNYRVSYTENIFSRLLHQFISQYLGLKSIVNKTSQDSKRTRMSYESSRNVVASREDFDVATKDTLSLSFYRDLFVAKTSALYKNTKKKIVSALVNSSGVDPLAIHWLEGDLLRGPMTLKTEMKVRKEAIKYFNALSYQQAFSFAEEACESKPKTWWEKLRSLFGGCKRDMQKAWNNYYIELTHHDITSSIYKACEKGKMKWWWSARKKVEVQKACMLVMSKKDPEIVGRDIPLWRLKDFMEQLQRHSENKIDYYNYFGIQNVFLYGSFDATTSDGSTYSANFAEGKFQGMGVVEDALRSGTRAPASVVIE